MVHVDIRAGRFDNLEEILFTLKRETARELIAKICPLLSAATAIFVFVFVTFFVENHCHFDEFVAD